MTHTLGTSGLVETSSGYLYRPLHVIINDLKGDWTEPWFGAVPYIEALSQLTTVEDRYYEDRGHDLLAYLISNTKYWRGETATRIKAEVRDILKKTR